MCCKTNRFPQDAFDVYFGNLKKHNYDFLRYKTQKSFKIKINSIISSVLYLNDDFINEHCKLFVIPYNRQYSFFEIDDSCMEIFKTDKEKNPEFNLENIEKYQKNERYKEKNRKKYLMGAFKNKNRILLQYKIYFLEN